MNFDSSIDSVKYYFEFSLKKGQVVDFEIVASHTGIQLHVVAPPVFAIWNSIRPFRRCLFLLILLFFAVKWIPDCVRCDVFSKNNAKGTRGRWAYERGILMNVLSDSRGISFD